MAFNIVYNILAIDKFTRVAKRIKSEFKSLEEKSKKFNKALGKTGKGFSKFGRKMTTHVSLPVAGIAAISVKTAATFERSMNMVQATSGATASQFKKLNDQSMKLGATTQFTATQVASGQEALSRMGAKTNTILSAMPSILTIAGATQSDFGEAAKVVTGVMASYNLTAAQMPRINDMIVATTLNSKTTLSSFGQATRLLGPIAHLAGMKFSEMAASVGILSNANIDAGQINTLLKRSIIEMIAPSTAMRKVMKEGHLTFRKSNGELKSMNQVLIDLKKSGITATGLMRLFGDRAGPLMAILVNKGAKALTKMQKKILDSGNLAKRVSDVQLRGLTGAFLKLKSAAQALAITTTTAVEPAIISMTDTMTKWLLGANNSTNATKRWAARIIGMGIILGPAISGLGHFLFWTYLILDKVPFASKIVRGLGLSFRFLFRGVLGPLSLITVALGLLAEVTAKLLIARGQGKAALKGIVSDFQKSGLNPLALGYYEAKRGLGYLFHHKKDPVEEGLSHIGIGLKPQLQKVHSTVDVNVFDPHRYIQNIAGKTTQGDMNLNLGTNMASSRY